MFETTVGNGAQQLRLEKEITETGRMDTDVAALLVDIVTSGELAFLAVRGSGGGLVAADLLVGVIDEILFVRHGVERARKLLEIKRWPLSRFVVLSSELALRKMDRKPCYNRAAERLSTSWVRATREEKSRGWGSRDDRRRGESENLGCSFQGDA